MIEQVLRDYLGESLSVPVYLELPDTVPESYVVLERTGGSLIDHLSTATFAIQSCGKRLLAAIELNGQVERLMERMPYELQCVSKAELSTAYNFTDTKTKIRRYQAIFIITYKE